MFQFQTHGGTAETSTCEVIWGLNTLRQPWRSYNVVNLVEMTIQVFQCVQESSPQKNVHNFGWVWRNVILVWTKSESETRLAFPLPTDGFCKIKICCELAKLLRFSVTCWVEFAFSLPSKGFRRPERRTGTTMSQRCSCQTTQSAGNTVENTAGNKVGNKIVNTELEIQL